ncbi:putative methyltransferase PMT28 [Platanthera guangdongensis]|uniref:Methyltransferase PMT28 n=1 Tax=Platanthera guangdongensis TaxID=2320717 RepID=A0ABR2LMI7_9ASPA
MGFMFRVRLSSFFAGATAASVAGFYFLYKDYMLTQQNISKQDKLNGVVAAIYLKPTMNECHDSKKLQSPPMCEEGDDPNAAWQVSNSSGGRRRLKSGDCTERRLE